MINSSPQLPMSKGESERGEVQHLRSTFNSNGLQPTSDVLHPSSDGLQPTSDVSSSKCNFSHIGIELAAFRRAYLPLQASRVGQNQIQFLPTIEH